MHAHTYTCPSCGYTQPYHHALAGAENAKAVVLRCTGDDCTHREVRLVKPRSQATRTAA